MIRFLFYICFFISVVPVSQLFSDELLTKQKILAPVMDIEGKKAPLKLKWEITKTTRDNSELTVTIHERDAFSKVAQRAVIYKRIENKYQTLAVLETHGYFSKPNFFWATPKGTGKTEQFLQITDIGIGTGHDVKEYVYCILLGGKIKKIAFIPAPQSFTGHLKSYEGILKGENNEFNDLKLTFSFYVWNPTDANCCPTAGKVTGTYEVRVIDLELKKYEIVMQGFKRAPFDPHED